MKQKRHILFMLCLLFLAGCNDEFEHETRTGKSVISPKIITKEELQKMPKAFEKVKILSGEKAVIAGRNMVHNREYDFSIDIDQILLIETEDYHSLTFPVHREGEWNRLVENVVLHPYREGYRAFLFQYGLSEADEERAVRYEPIRDEPESITISAINWVGDETGYTIYSDEDDYLFTRWINGKCYASYSVRRINDTEYVHTWIECDHCCGKTGNDGWRPNNLGSLLPNFFVLAAPPGGNIGGGAGTGDGDGSGNGTGNGSGAPDVQDPVAAQLFGIADRNGNIITTPFVQENNTGNHISQLKKFTDNKNGQRTIIKEKIDDLRSRLETDYKEDGAHYIKQGSNYIERLPAWQGDNMIKYDNGDAVHPKTEVVVHMHQNRARKLKRIVNGEEEYNYIDLAPIFSGDDLDITAQQFMDTGQNKNFTSILVSREGTFALRIGDRGKVKAAFEYLDDEDNIENFRKKFKKDVLDKCEELSNSCYIQNFINFLNSKLPNGKTMGLLLFKAVYNQNGDITDWIQL